MDFGRLFTQVRHTFVQNPALILLGFLAVLGTELAGVTLAAALPDPNDITPNAVVEFGGVIDQWASDLSGVMRDVLLFTAVLLIIWLIATLAEGGLIVAMKHKSQGRSTDLITATQDGIAYLGRLIIADTLIFFPLFILLLLALAILSSALIGSVTQLTAGSSPISWMIVAVVGCGILPILGIPVLVITFLMRIFVFRDIIFHDRALRPSIAYSRQLLRQHIGSAFLIGIGLIVLQLMVQFGVALVSAPFNWLIANTGTLDGVAAAIIFILSLVAGGCMFALRSVIWSHLFIIATKSPE